MEVGIARTQVSARLLTAGSQNNFLEHAYPCFSASEASRYSVVLEGLRRGSLLYPPASHDLWRLAYSGEVSNFQFLCSSLVN